MKPFRIVATPASVKNGSSSVGVAGYTSLLFTVFPANPARLWIAIAFQTVSRFNLFPDSRLNLEAKVSAGFRRGEMI